MNRLWVVTIVFLVMMIGLGITYRFLGINNADEKVFVALEGDTTIKSTKATKDAKEQKLKESK